MDEAAANGIYGCWWIELKELVRTFGKDDIKDKLEAFEAELASERKLAMHGSACSDQHCCPERAWCAVALSMFE